MIEYEKRVSYEQCLFIEDWHRGNLGVMPLAAISGFTIE